MKWIKCDVCGEEGNAKEHIQCEQVKILREISDALNAIVQNSMKH